MPFQPTRRAERRISRITGSRPTSEGEWARAALPALTLVLVGLLPVILLIRRSARRVG